VSAFEAELQRFILDQYHQRPHSETGEPPQARWESGGFLPWGVATFNLKIPECGHHTLFLPRHPHSGGGAVSANLLYGFGHVNLQIRVVIIAQYFARLVSRGHKERRQ
jgi:hypothetical protein